MLFGFGSALASEQEQFWRDNGYLVLEGFFKPEETATVNAVVQRLIDNPRSLGTATVDVLTGEYIGKRFRGSEAPPEASHGPILRSMTSFSTSRVWAGLL